MSESVVRKKLKAAELEPAIMQRLGDNPDCAGIVQVYVKYTSRQPGISLLKRPGHIRWYLAARPYIGLVRKPLPCTPY